MNPINIIKSIPYSTRVFVIVIILLSSVSKLLPSASEEEEGAEANAHLSPLLAMVPGRAIAHPWTFLTAGFFESNIVVLIIRIVAFALCGKYLEYIWGGGEFFRYVLLIQGFTMFISCCTFLILYSITFNSNYLYSLQCSGLHGLICSFMVAFKQQCPEYSISLFKGTFSIRAKFIPIVIITLHIILYAAHFIEVEFFMCLFGMWISWIYLRFYQTIDGVKGDKSPTMTFKSFFPEKLQFRESPFDFINEDNINFNFSPIIKPISNVTYKLLLLLHCCTKENKLSPDLETGSEIATVSRSATNAPAPVKDDIDAERRRALALRALDIRMQQVQVQTAEPSYKLADHSML